jgi:hypothetical protein
MHGCFILLFCLLAASAFAADEVESLSYSINWPSGLSLGEGRLESRKTAEGHAHQLVLQAEIPGFVVHDEFLSSTDAKGCSLAFEKKTVHGKRSATETITFDTAAKSLVRETTGGGKTKVETGACARDALAFLQFLRRELSQGRLPPQQTIYFGAAYQIRVQYLGELPLVINDVKYDTGRFAVTVKGPASEIGFEILLTSDARRIPAQIRLPLAMGTFTMEWLP